MPALVTFWYTSIGTMPDYSLHGCISLSLSELPLGLPKTSPATQWSCLKEQKSLYVEMIPKGVECFLLQFHKTNKKPSSIFLYGCLIESPWKFYFLWLGLKNFPCKMWWGSGRKARVCLTHVARKAQLQHLPAHCLEHDPDKGQWQQHLDSSRT